MSYIKDKAMRGQYISKEECFTHAEELEDVYGSYGAAMNAMEEYERKMSTCTCDYDADDEGHGCRVPNAACPVDHGDEDTE